MKSLGSYNNSAISLDQYIYTINLLQESRELYTRAYSLLDSKIDLLYSELSLYNKSYFDIGNTITKNNVHDKFKSIVSYLASSDKSSFRNDYFYLSNEDLFNYNIVMISKSSQGAYYKLFNQTSEYVFYINNIPMNSFPSTFILSNTSFNTVSYYRKDKTIEYVSSFNYIKPMNSNDNQFDFCKNFFINNTDFDNLKSQEYTGFLSISQNYLSGFCDENGSDFLYENIMDYYQVLSLKQLKQYITYLINRQNSYINEYKNIINYNDLFQSDITLYNNIMGASIKLLEKALSDLP